MKSLSIALSIIGSIAAATALLVYFILPQLTVASVPYGNEYQSVVMKAADIGTTSVKSISGSLGSIVLTDNATNGFIRVYDSSATTSATTTLTLIAEVDAAAVENTYVFDVAVGKGVFVDVPTGFDGTFTLTYR